MSVFYKVDGSSQMYGGSMLYVADAPGGNPPSEDGDIKDESGNSIMDDSDAVITDETGA